MHYWKVCMLFTCNPECTSTTSRYQWRDSIPFKSKESTTSATKASYPILQSSTFQKALQLGERRPPLTGRHHPYSTEWGQSTLPKWPSLFRQRRAVLNWYKWPLMHAKSSPSSMTTTEWAAVHRTSNRAPMFNRRGDEARWLPAKKIVVQNVSRNT